jgi:serine protease AprX
MVGGPNNDSIIGVAPEAKWIGCRNMEEGDGTPSTYIECFQWFLAPTNLSNLLPDPTQAPHVINNSWGCPVSEGCNTGNFMAMELAVNALKSAGSGSFGWQRWTGMFYHKFTRRYL